MVRKKKSNCWVWILLSLVILGVLVGCGCYYFFWYLPAQKAKADGKNSTNATGTKTKSSTSGSPEPRYSEHFDPEKKSSEITDGFEKSKTDEKDSDSKGGSFVDTLKGYWKQAGSYLKETAIPYVKANPKLIGGVLAGGVVACWGLPWLFSSSSKPTGRSGQPGAARPAPNASNYAASNNAASNNAAANNAAQQAQETQRLHQEAQRKQQEAARKQEEQRQQQAKARAERLEREEAARKREAEQAAVESEGEASEYTPVPHSLGIIGEFFQTLTSTGSDDCEPTRKGNCKPRVKPDYLVDEDSNSITDESFQKMDWDRYCYQEWEAAPGSTDDCSDSAFRDTCGGICNELYPGYYSDD